MRVPGFVKTHKTQLIAVLMAVLVAVSTVVGTTKDIVEAGQVIVAFVVDRANKDFRDCIKAKEDGNWSAAERFCEKVIEKNPGHLLAQAELLLIQGQRAKTLEERKEVCDGFKEIAGVKSLDRSYKASAFYHIGYLCNEPNGEPQYLKKALVMSYAAELEEPENVDLPALRREARKYLIRFKRERDIIEIAQWVDSTLERIKREDLTLKEAIRIYDEKAATIACPPAGPC